MDHPWLGYTLTIASLFIYFATLLVYRKQLRTMELQLGQMHKQLEEMQKHIREDHERSRREETLRLMRFWAERVDALPTTLPHATKLCRRLERTQLIALFEALSFEVPASERSFVERAISGDQSFQLPVKDNDHLEVPDKVSYHIRKQVTCYFNIFEVIATAWFDNIGDRDLLEREFGTGIDKSGDLVVALNQLFGFYPAAAEFVKRPKKGNQPRLPTGA